MPSYALLLAPSANRVYADAAARIGQAELTVFAGSGALDGALTDIGAEEIGGVPYLMFAADPTERDLALLGNLSAAYALFERVGELLRPVPVRPLRRFDDDLITIPKYAGKTNEQFTQLLLNVTVLPRGRASASTGRLTVLDPLCRPRHHDQPGPDVRVRRHRDRARRQGRRGVRRVPQDLAQAQADQAPRDR